MPYSRDVFVHLLILSILVTILAQAGAVAAGGYALPVILTYFLALVGLMLWGNRAGKERHLS